MATDPEALQVTPGNLAATARDDASLTASDGAPADKAKAYRDAAVMKAPDLPPGAPGPTETEAALRDSEARFRSLTELSADWYWQQDENLRFTEASGGTATTAALRSLRDLGQTRWELPVFGVSDEAWHAHKVTLAARLPFRDFEFSRLGSDGERRDVSVSGTPYYDADGRFAGYRGIGTDLTERKRAERLVALEQQVARCLAEAGEQHALIGDIVRVIGQALGWKSGYCFERGAADDVPKLTASWDGHDASDDTRDGGADPSAVAGAATLAGHVSRSLQPMWQNDAGACVSLLGVKRDAPDGIFCGFAFPITADMEALGAVTFVAPRMRGPDERLDAVARTIGGQIGQFMKRKSAEDALRESEARFRSLSGLSADWYWQQDAQLRFTSLCNGTEIEAGLASDADWGKTRWELDGVGEADWESHKRTLADRRPFVDFEVRRTFPDGSVRDTSISGIPIIDAHGQFAGYRGIGRDVTHRKHEARVLELEHRIARFIADATDTAPVICHVMQAIGESQGWLFGAYMHVDEAANLLRAAATWASPAESLDEFTVVASALTVAPGEGISGRVWQTGQPFWVSDVETDSRLLKADQAVVAGFHAAFAFAIEADAKTVGVMIFFSRDRRAPDARVLSAARMIGAQVGQFQQRRQAEDRLRFQAMLLNTVGDAVMAADMDQTISYWSAAAEQLYGWSREEAIGQRMQDMVRPASGSHSGALFDVQNNRIWRGEKIGYRRDGTSFPAHLTLAPVQAANGTVTGMVSVSRDISEIKRAEQVIRDNARQQSLIAAFGQRALARTSLDILLDEAASAAVDGLSLLHCKILQLASDGKSLVARAERGFDRASNDRHGPYSGAGVFDRPTAHILEAVIVDDYAREADLPEGPSLSRQGIRSGAYVVIGGAAGPFGMLGAYASEPARFDAASVNFLQSIANTLATAIDRMAAEEKVAHFAQFDALTGLPNRNLFRERMAWTLTQAQRNSWSVGVMFIDLDRFKEVNDTHGHGIGDRLLIMVAERLRQCVRAGDTVGRLGGDEFLVVLSNLPRADDANVVAQQIVEELARPFIVDGLDLRVTASIGISLYPADGGESEVLLKKADAAMYLAKQQGRNGFHFYTEEVNARVTRRMELEVELRRAIAHDEFVLHYQPQVSLDTGRIVGVEALIRWQHPVRGLLAPADFIGVAEETALIVPIGRWVANRACAQAAHWHRNGYPGLFMAINVSPLEIRRGNVPQSIREAVAQSGLDPRYLEIELTETLIMDGADFFIRAIEALKATGVTISIDDFGTGYSSLSYLKRFPVDKVKIDRMFVRDIASDGDDAAIAQAIIAMSHHLKLRVTAEGVETEAQAEFLRRSRCDIVQGFLFGRPVNAAQMSVLLASRGSVALSH